MPQLKDQIPKGFNCPTSEPKNPEELAEWQKANQNWWQNHPMRYDWRDQIAAREFSTEFYDEIDRRFFRAAKEYMPWFKIPFDPLIDFSSLASQDVLEIGIGNGSHAQLLAEHARSFTGIDLTEYAVKSVRERMRLKGLKANICQMEAESLQFPDSKFDFIWSWGVIHHSSDPQRILKEIRRVLKPGGTAVLMVYHRNFWNYHVQGWLRGVFQGYFAQGKSIHEIIQLEIDGALARFYSISEWHLLTSEHFDVKHIQIFGSKAGFIPLPGGRFKDTVSKFIPNALSRFFTNRLQLGTFLVSTLRKK